jgi:hypothetical protein
MGGVLSSTACALAQPFVYVLYGSEGISKEEETGELLAYL